MARFYLVRHGQASFGASNYDQLSDLGHQQARWLGEYFMARDVRFDGLFHGDMVRHQETAAGILEGMQATLPAHIDTGLNEFDFQALVKNYLASYPHEAPTPGSPASAFYKVLKKAMREWQLGTLQGEMPESWQAFSQRVEQAQARIQQEYGDKENVLIVSSGGAISLFIRHLLSMADEMVIELNLQVRNSSVTEGFFNHNAMRLSSFNTIPHLDRSDRLSAITYT